MTSLVNNYQEINNYNICIVCSDQVQFKLFAQYLRAEFAGVRIFFTEDYLEVFELVNKKVADLVIMDLDSEYGKTLLLKLKKSGLLGLICSVLVSSEDSNKERLWAFEDGIDDYIIKPIIVDQLLARVKGLLKKNRKVGSQRRILTAGDIKMNISNFTVEICGRGMKVSSKEFNILKLFLENPEKVFTREEILKEIWPDNHLELSVRIVDVHINRLRIALGSNRGNRSYIRTVRGFGYSLDTCEYNTNSHFVQTNHNNMGNLSFLYSGSNNSKNDSYTNNKIHNDIFATYDEGL